MKLFFAILLLLSSSNFAWARLSGDNDQCALTNVAQGGTNCYKDKSDLKFSSGVASLEELFHLVFQPFIQQFSYNFNSKGVVTSSNGMFTTFLDQNGNPKWKLTITSQMTATQDRQITRFVFADNQGAPLLKFVFRDAAPKLVAPNVLNLRSGQLSFFPESPDIYWHELRVWFANQELFTMHLTRQSANDGKKLRAEFTNPSETNAGVIYEEITTLNSKQITYELNSKKLFGPPIKLRALITKNPEAYLGSETFYINDLEVPLEEYLPKFQLFVIQKLAIEHLQIPFSMFVKFFFFIKPDWGSQSDR